MTDNDTNLDQQQAEAHVLQAKTGEEWAAAMNLHFNAVRNLQMTEIVPSFRDAVEVLIKREVGSLAKWLENSDRARLDQTVHVNLSLTRLHEENNATLAELKVVSANLGKTQADMAALKDGYNSNAARITALEEYSRGSRRAELDAVVHTQAAHDKELLRLGREVEAIKPFFTMLLSPEEQSDKDDAAASLAAELRELLALMREERARRANDGNGG